MSFLTTVIADRVNVDIPRVVGDYEFLRPITETSYSVVCLVRSRVANSFCVCKVVPRALLDLPDQMKSFEQEVRILQAVSHPNIVQLTEVIYTADLILVMMEHCSGGDLLQMIEVRGRLDDAQIRGVLADVLSGLAYLHERHIFHRDIKPENILIDASGIAKIADFGLSRFMSHDALLQTPCGSISYCAPEILQGREYDGCLADVWSLGIVVFAMCSGRLPWASATEAEIEAQVSHGGIGLPPIMSAVIGGLLRQMLQPDPARRPTVAQLLAQESLGAILRPRAVRLIESASLNALQLGHSQTGSPVRSRIWLSRPTGLARSTTSRLGPPARPQTRAVIFRPGNPVGMPGA
jgi:serine/threonine protein kinase